METYLLWNPSSDEREKTLSFFATQANIQRINQGTREMIEAMLRDLKLLGEVPFSGWAIERFITNYLTDDPEGETWEDSWAETWEIVLSVAAPVELDPERFYPVSSFERDTTWDGEWTILPAECVVVADFGDAEQADRAMEILETVAASADDPSLAAELQSTVADAPEELFAKLRRAYAQRRGRGEPPTVRRRASYPQQLLISLGVVDEDFFADGGELASLVAELCEYLGATTIWDETFNPE